MGATWARRQATGDVLAFVNSDAVVAPAALGHLATAALEPDVGMHGQHPARARSGPARLGRQRDPPPGHGLGGSLRRTGHHAHRRRPVASASGAGMAIARATWDRVGGFCEEYFAHHEDADLSLRCWQQGLSVVFVPEAVVVHHYEFSRNPDKLYLLERNRAVFLLTLYENEPSSSSLPLLLSSSRPPSW